MNHSCTSVTIVMYHYVRSIKKSRFNKIKGLELSDFLNQLYYIQKNFTPICSKQVVEALTVGASLPPNAILLTFDDGYIDHYHNVFRYLRDGGVVGCFFPPVKAICDTVVLDVHKIHYLLASTEKKDLIIEKIQNAMAEERSCWNLEPDDFYQKTYRVPNRFDDADVNYIKRMLQVALPLPLRKKILDELFQFYVTVDEHAFSRELYMDEQQLKEMICCGMEVGVHGYNHIWLNQISSKEQEVEIDLSLRFLEHLGMGTSNWIMSYPYGGWNDSLVSLIAQKGCAFGLTADFGVADLKNHNRYLFPRVDANDIL